ncbi:hypothetical protein MASR2M29_06980 [Spirochaetota bacterium]
MLALSSAFAEEEKESTMVYGHAENYEIFSLSKPLEYSGMSKLELVLDARPSPASRLHAAFEVTNLRGSIASQTPAQDFFLFDIPSLYISVWKGPWDFSVGKQPVKLGKGMIFSPADIFCPPALELGNARNAAVYASKASLSLGNYSAMEAVAVFNTKAEEGSYALDFQSLVYGFEIIAMGFYEDNPLNNKSYGAALAFKGDLLFGIYAEAAMRFSQGSTRPSWQASAGLDYSFGRDIFMVLEYFYNQGPYVLEKPHYMGFSAKYAFSELASLSALLLSDLPDLNFASTLLFEYSLAQDTKLAVLLLYDKGNIKNDTKTKNSLHAGIKLALYF